MVTWNKLFSRAKNKTNSAEVLQVRKRVAEKYNIDINKLMKQEIKFDNDDIF